ncbi:MAG: phosphatidate cytidylyltransferase [Spirochaetaceae bacterium]|nr:phosphatidate cytidylyltransferase [Spirochaetaceae bacterium]
MKNTIIRLLLFFLAIPALIMIILYLPQFGNLSVIILLTIVGILCGLEMRIMLSSVAKHLPRWTVLMPGIAPVLAWAVNLDFIPESIAITAFIAAIIWAFSDAVFVPATEFKDGITRIGGRLMMIIYPGWLLWWVARLTWFENAHIILLVFMLTVYLNDALAWFFGMLFGKHRNILAVSPNKSLEGFLGGILTSIAVILLSAYFNPSIFPHPYWQLILFGIVVAFTTTIGDLVESAIKRAAGVKDSGNVIPGRGGMLDSIDSVLFTAPVFVLFLQLAV